MSKVVFTQPAEIDLISIEDYIWNTLYNPDAAIRIIDGIVDMAERLALFPNEHQYVGDSFLADLGFRMTMFDNYNIFYIYNELSEI